MQAGKPHIVKTSTLILEKEISGEREDYQALMERLSVMCNQSLPNLFEESFTEVVPENETWQIDRLEVEVDIENLLELEKSIRNRLPYLIKRALEKTSLKSTTVQGGNAILGESTTPTGLVLYYLRTGMLPWNSQRGFSVVDINKIFEDNVVKDVKFAGELLQLFMTQEKTLERFLLYFEKPHHWQFYEAVQKASSGRHILSYSDWLHRYKEVKEKGAAAEKSFWHQILETKSEERNLGSREESDTTDSRLKPEEVETLKSETDEDSIYLEPAGLIFLHPFISRFLERLQLVNEKELLDPDQAACALHSLVTGESPESEWQLILPKILLGLKLDTPLAIRPVSTDQINSGVEMIQAAISHWSVLGNTSVTGFREGFLQRPGKLTSFKEGWLLELERAAHDMLIDQLPWQMSYIQLPWMKACIRMNV